MFSLSISKAYSAVSNAASYLPSVRLSTAQEVASKVKKCALCAFVLLALSQAQEVSAGPLAYAACVAECSVLTLGGFLPLCLAGCAPLLMAPTP